MGSLYRRIQPYEELKKVDPLAPSMLVPYKKWMRRWPKKTYKKSYPGAYKLRRAEVKKHNFDQVSIVVQDAVAYYAMLHGIARGSSVNERVGNKIANKYLDIRGQIVRNAAGPSTQSVRIVLVVDTQQISDDLVLTWAEVFGTDFNSHINVETAGRFTILKDEIVTVGATIENQLPFHYYIPLKGMTTRFNGANATDIESRGIYLLALADTECGVNGPSLVCKVRIGFTDL